MNASQLDAAATGDAALPAACYTDPAVFLAEQERLFLPGWMSVGFASELPNPGDVLPLTVLGRPVVLTRDSAGELHVFANVCRHRGHILATQPCNNQHVLTCPYHAWSYRLDGQFVNAPYWDGSKRSAPDAQLKPLLGLLPLRFAVWYDTVFVNFSHDAESFETYIGSLDSRWRTQRDPQLLRSFSNRSFTMEGNWKLVAENFLDNYHLPWIHPQVGSSVESSLGLAVDELRLGNNVIGFSHPTSGKDKSKTESALPSWPGMSDSEQLRQDLFYLFPNTCLVMEGNYLWVMALLPDRADHCAEKVALYVVGDDAMQAQHVRSRSQLADTIYQVNEQDSRVIGGLQRGRQGDAASLGMFNPHHDQLGKWFHQAVAGFLQP